jgi:hypothetical protein
LGPESVGEVGEVGEVDRGFSSMVESGIQAVERGAKYAVGITILKW